MTLGQMFLESVTLSITSFNLLDFRRLIVQGKNGSNVFAPRQLSIRVNTGLIFPRIDFSEAAGLVPILPQFRVGEAGGALRTSDGGDDLRHRRGLAG